MKNDFELITHKFDSDITIVPIGDVHFGCINHNQVAWRKFCEDISKNDNTYLVLIGDLINNGLRNSVGSPFEENIRPREQKTMMTDYLLPIRDRILCAVGGNHERRSMKEADVDLTYDIMARLSIEDLYRENAAFMKLSLGKRSYAPNRAEAVYSIVCMHGAGGGQTGSAVNRNERFSSIIDGADCFISGHTHKPVISRPSKIVIDTKNNVVVTKPVTVVTCTSWLDYGGYALQNMLTPSETANPQKLKLISSRDKRIEVTW